MTSGRSGVGGYCYAHRIVFLDKETLEPIDVDLYDNSGNFWKGILDTYYPTPLPGSPGDYVSALGGKHLLWPLMNGGAISPNTSKL
jgi:hypothetical protein